MTDRISKQVTDAVANDPSIFMYDEIYDDIKGKPKQVIETQKARYTVRQQPLKSKYIDAMKRGAYKKEREKEIISEKMNLKRLKESNDEENVFVTEAYLEQQKERKKIEEEMRKQEEYDQEHSVNKDKDMIAFSKYLLKKQIGGIEKQKIDKNEKVDLSKKPVHSNEATTKSQRKDDKKDIVQKNEQKSKNDEIKVPKPKFYSQKNHEMKQTQKKQQEK